MKIFLMSQDSVDLEKPTKAKFAIMWDAMKKMHEPSVIEGSAEAINQLVEIIRKMLRAKQLPRASDWQFARIANGIGMGNSWVPSTHKHVVKTAEEMQTDYPVRRDERFRHGYILDKIDETRLAWSCAIDSRISLAYSAGEDDPTPLVADLFPAHKPSYSSCTNRLMNLWMKEANDTESRTTFIQGKKKAEERLWKLIIIAEEPEDITTVDDEMYKELSAQCRKADELAYVRRRYESNNPS
jgi:hypothetical protein